MVKVIKFSFFSSPLSLLLNPLNRVSRICLLALLSPEKFDERLKPLEFDVFLAGTRFAVSKTVKAVP